MVDEQWRAPEMSRRPEPMILDERSGLEAWLDYHRETLLMKCQGLTAAQLCDRSLPPSTLSLLGLVRHMSEVERGWFRQGVDRQDVPEIYCTPERREADFEDVDDADPQADLDILKAEMQAAREAAAGHALTDELPVHRGNRRDVRWVYVHMIEEYARHNGHADLLRERIDGVTGD